MLLAFDMAYLNELRPPEEEYDKIKNAEGGSLKSTLVKLFPVIRHFCGSDTSSDPNQTPAVS